MRIREVIEKTGLTDRAVRFYIDEGLVLPYIEESYSGRKSIDFSEKDVERLNNVALLRKAGFSVADIRSIIDDNSTAKNIIEKFIGQAENDIAHKTEIVEKLKGVSFDEEVTLEKICSSLSFAVTEKEIPAEDIKLTLAEKIFKIAVIIFAGALVVFAVWIFAVCCIEMLNVRYLKITNNPITLCGSAFYLGWIAVAALAVAVIIKNIGKGFQRKNKRKSMAFLASSFIGTIIMLPITFVFLFITVTPFYSQTTESENYLQIDEVLMSADYSNDALGDLFEIFPRKIPESARLLYPESVKYFYEYMPCWDYFYGSYDICAEWTLPAAEYQNVKNNLPNDFVLENQLAAISDTFENLEADQLKEQAVEQAAENSGYKIIQKNDWTLIYYKGYGQVSFDDEDESENNEDKLRYEKSKNEFEIENWNKNGHTVNYDFLICAYNDKEQRIRYIASASRCYESRKNGPYYLSLEW